MILMSDTLCINRKKKIFQVTLLKRNYNIYNGNSLIKYIKCKIDTNNNK